MPIRFPTILIIMLLTLSSPTLAQHRWQKPKPPIPKATLDQIIGPITTKSPSKPLDILWVWGYDKNHAPGAHDYVRVRDLFTSLLKKIPQTKVSTAYLFPTKNQFRKADLIVFFLHLPQLTDQQFTNFKAYINRGGGVVALHESAIIRPASKGKKLAECLGMAWDEGRSKWGAIFDDITIKNQHPIFKGFPDKLKIVDEFYWNLNIKKTGVSILGSVRTGPPRNSRGPIHPSKLSKKHSPMFWTLEMGKGRVFGTTTGHNTFSYYDPELRIILFRAMAWTLREKPDPFMPLVFHGITSKQNLVGTLNDFRKYPNKPRRPPRK